MQDFCKDDSFVQMEFMCLGTYVLVSFDMNILSLVTELQKYNMIWLKFIDLYYDLEFKRNFTEINFLIWDEDRENVSDM